MTNNELLKDLANNWQHKIQRATADFIELAQIAGCDARKVGAILLAHNARALVRLCELLDIPMDDALEVLREDWPKQRKSK